MVATIAAVILVPDSDIAGCPIFTIFYIPVPAMFGIIQILYYSNLILAAPIYYVWLFCHSWFTIIIAFGVDIVG